MFVRHVVSTALDLTLSRHAVPIAIGIVSASQTLKRVQGDFDILTLRLTVN